MPQCRPMPDIGQRCHELRVVDKNRTWRIFYRIDHDVIVIVDVVAKTTEKTPQQVIKRCQKRLKDYDDRVKAERKKSAAKGGSPPKKRS
jgi:phage-related protein